MTVRGVPRGVEAQGQLLADLQGRIAALERKAARATPLPPPTLGAIPVGGFMSGPWNAAQSNGALDLAGDGAVWFQVRAQTITDGALTYPELASLYPGWVSGNNLILPSSSLRVIQHVHGGTPGAVGGANSRSITTSNMPSHVHTMPTHSHTYSGGSVSVDHDHANHNISGGSHSHVLNPPLSFNSGVATSFWWRSTSPTHAAGFDGDTNTNTSHSHGVNLPNYNVANRTVTGSTISSVDPGDTNSAGSGTAFDVQQAQITQRLFVRAA